MHSRSSCPGAMEGPPRRRRRRSAPATGWSSSLATAAGPSSKRSASAATRSGRRSSSCPRSRPSWSSSRCRSSSGGSAAPAVPVCPRPPPAGRPDVPDLATHVAAGWMLGRGAGLLHALPTRSVYLFTLGSAVPDLLARAPHLALGSALVERATRPLHTPAALILITLGASFAFETAVRRAAFAALALGALFHCFL